MNKFTTSRGIEVEFLSVTTLEEEFRATHKLPNPPTYTIETMTGVTEIIPLDAQSLTQKPEQFTAEQHAAWKDYQACLVIAERDYIRGLMRLYLMYGIKVEAPSTDEWIKKQEFVGMEVPTDPLEQQLHYIKTEVMGSREDYTEISLGIMKASGVSADLLEQVAESFRGHVSRNTARKTGNSQGKVDGEQKVRAGTRSVSDGKMAKRMGSRKSTR